MDEIRISNLEVFGHHGVYTEENTLGQKFLVSAVLYTDTRKAGHTDSLEDSINYGDVCHEIKHIMEARNYKLLEAVAETIADRLLHIYPALERIRIEIKKPWAPIMLPIDTVAVSIERGWHTVYFSIGSNMGERAEHLDYAVDRLRTDNRFRNVEVSAYLETEPYGYVEQDKFLNACIVCQTLLPAQDVLDVIHELEQERGRTREIHWGPRTLDIDILFYDREIIEQKDLCIPHPEIPYRMFVLQPLAELAPYYHHPVTGKTVLDMLQELSK
jgi:dihydroneopterin aldolase/2-amino-4-hydroxy-6-hydroxymethyldihydropteridine diphosphokinase